MLTVDFLIYLFFPSLFGVYFSHCWRKTNEFNLDSFLFLFPFVHRKYEYHIFFIDRTCYFSSIYNRWCNASIVHAILKCVYARFLLLQIWQLSFAYWNIPYCYCPTILLTKIKCFFLYFMNDHKITNTMTRIFIVTIYSQ